MSSAIERLHSRLERKIAECRNETAESGQLLRRAQRLNERLENLKYKLRMSFQLEGEETPDNLQITLQQMADVDPDGAPEEFVCPITQCLMVDPVATCDGQIYDRCAIIEWFSSFSGGRQPRSPLTNLPLENRNLLPKPELASRIQAFLNAHSGIKPKGEVLEEPSIRQLPAGLLGSEQRTTPTVKTSSGPIWSSSVVPSSETDSRILNLLRVNDALPLPEETSRSRSSAVQPIARQVQPQRRTTRSSARHVKAIAENRPLVERVDTRTSALYRRPVVPSAPPVAPLPVQVPQALRNAAQRVASQGGPSSAIRRQPTQPANLNARQRRL